MECRQERRAQSRAPVIKRRRKRWKPAQEEPSTGYVHPLVVSMINSKDLELSCILLPWNSLVIYTSTTRPFTELENRGRKSLGKKFYCWWMVGGHPKGHGMGVNAVPSRVFGPVPPVNCLLLVLLKIKCYYWKLHHLQH